MCDVMPLFRMKDNMVWLPPAESFCVKFSLEYEVSEIYEELDQHLNTKKINENETIIKNVKIPIGIFNIFF